MHTFCVAMVLKWYGVSQGTPADDWWSRPLHGRFVLPNAHSWNMHTTWQNCKVK